MDKNICSSIHMTSPGTFITVSTEQTQALGTLLGTLLSAGDVLILTGDLGAGKTQLTKGIAAGMQITDDVTSPTFTIEMVSSTMKATKQSAVISTALQPGVLLCHPH